MIVSSTIQAFFAERKETWLKSKLTAKLSDEDQTKIIAQADEKFALHTWLEDAAKRAKELSISSHPTKFSHPGAKRVPIIAQAEYQVDGYLRTGNIPYELDVYGNAGSIDVYKFLMLVMSDGQSVLAHLEQDSDDIKQLLHSESVSYETLKDGFLSIKAVDDTAITDRLVKQVYFPIEENEYHLLSLLTPSGLITELKRRIDDMGFSEETKQAKEHRKNNTTHPTGYDDMLNLTLMGYGGSHPKNVSFLCLKNYGLFYLLASTPPSLKQRAVKLPNRDFFASNLRRKAFAESFEALHRLTQLEINNVAIREGINSTLKFMIDQILEQAFKVRVSGGIGWSQTEHYANLPKAQAIWLDDAYLEERESTTEWITEISRQMVAWLALAFEQSMKQNKLLLGGEELAHIKQFAHEAIAEDQEFFK